MKKFASLIAAGIVAGACIGLPTAQAQVLFIPSYPSTNYYYQDRDYCVGTGFVISTPGFYACVNDRSKHRYGYPYRSNRFMNQRHYVYPRYQVEQHDGHWGRNDHDNDRGRDGHDNRQRLERDRDNDRGRGDGRSMGRHR